MKKALVQFIVSINAIVLIQTAYGNFPSFWEGARGYYRPDYRVSVGVNNADFWEGARGYYKPDYRVAVGVNNADFWEGARGYYKPDYRVAIAINVDADNQTIQQAVAAGVAQALADYMKKKEGNKKKPTPAILYLP